MGEYAVRKRVPSQLKEGAKIAIVMDFPSSNEVRLNKILAGDFIINKICRMAGIQIEDCMLTHTFQLKPAQDNPQNFFHKKSEYKALCKESKWRSSYPNTTLGYLKQEMEQDLQRLHNELNETNPNVIIAMGGVSLWALTGFDKVKTYRGAIIPSSSPHLKREFKVITSYPPSSVLKNYDFRAHVFSDFKKAKRESTFKDINYIERELWIEPTIDDLYTFKREYIDQCGELNPLSFDIETAEGQTRCIGFAPSLKHAIVVPFWMPNPHFKNYWSREDEPKAWAWVKDLLEDERTVKVAQNQTYDVSWLSFKNNIKVKGLIHDTMHAHHSLQPEMEKGLAFLGSIYTNEGAWKTLAKFSKSTKADE